MPRHASTRRHTSTHKRAKLCSYTRTDLQIYTPSDVQNGINQNSHRTARSRPGRRRRLVLLRYADSPSARDGTSVECPFRTRAARASKGRSPLYTQKTKKYTLNFNYFDYLCVGKPKARNGERQFSQDVGFPRDAAPPIPQKTRRPGRSRPLPRPSTSGLHLAPTRRASAACCARSLTLQSGAPATPPGFQRNPTTIGNEGTKE